MFGILDKIYGRSPKWRKVRAEHIKNNPECAACGRTEGLEVHHIIPYHVNPDLELEPANLITLCGKYCHFVFGHLMDWKSWNENIAVDSLVYRTSKRNRPYKDTEFGSQQKGYSNAFISTIISICNWPFKFLCRND